MIIGYSVIHVNDDISVKDLLWGKRVVYSTWDKALEKAQLKANEIKYELGDDDNYLISNVTSKSQEKCDKSGNERIITIEDKIYKFSTDIYIVPVYDE
jgi:hypothetical protein